MWANGVYNVCQPWHVDDKLHEHTVHTARHTGVRSAGTQSDGPNCAHSVGTHGVRRGRGHAPGACLSCRVPPVYTSEGRGMPPRWVRTGRMHLSVRSVSPFLEPN